MGCCFSSGDDKTSQTGETNENRRLLDDPVSVSANRTASRLDYGTHFVSPYGQRGDEQSALNKILQQTASNIIDVSAMDTHIQQQDCLDKARQYNQKLNEYGRKSAYTCIPKRVCLLADLPAPEKILSVDPVIPADLQFMKESLSKVCEALQGVKVIHREDLVVQFGIP